ncbi:metal-dependent hydrolase [Bythopirellula goksoeyrii]|uniref:metal-dependent hydrolase n=1 Tax=Bythopirellula goksoeyrii TaxID=1400387 RepID=UPI0011CD7111|nr:metal-dependent hydrolase [Bythopirellula goksoeyrii]
MSVEITWLGHSSFTLKTERETLLVDPFLDESPTAPIKASAIETDYILQTHGHFDHILDTVAIAQRTHARVLGNFEICEWLKQQGVAEDQLTAMNLGGGVNLPFGRAQMTVAHHSSGLPDGSYGGSAAGFLLDLVDLRIYISGDTALFSDMKLIGLRGIDLAILPIGDLFTLGPEDAIEAIKLLDCRRVIPCHYNTWPPIEQDVTSWAERVRTHTTCEPLLLAPGTSITL